MKSRTKDYLVIIGCFIAIGIVSLSSGIKIANIMTESVEEATTEQVIETTTAKPIYQQQIGDEAESDVLIIYEAEVDGVKVYPSVIKEENNGRISE